MKNSSSSLFIICLVGCNAANQASSEKTVILRKVIAPANLNSGLSITLESNKTLTIRKPKSYSAIGEEKLEMSLETIKIPFNKFLNKATRNNPYQSEIFVSKALDNQNIDWSTSESKPQLIFSLQLPEGAIEPEQELRCENENYTWQTEKYRNRIKLLFAFRNKVRTQIPTDLNWKIANSQPDQEIINSLLNNLISATNMPNMNLKDHGFPPFGFSNDLYFGHVFWDMDVWILPSLALFAPDKAREMVTYRLDRVAQAKKNAAEFFKKPAGTMFPWESSVTGKETVPGSSRKQHHITGSVAWGMTQAEALGIVSSDEIKEAISGANEFYQARSVKTERGREIKDTMSPDENHIGDNDLYTNLLAYWLSQNRTWTQKPNYYLPKDEKSFLTYENDALRGYKQAAAVLAIFPLQYPPAEAQARTMMERFENKVSKNGPAMSDSIHATIWARLGETEKAYDAWKRSWEPFLDKTNMNFSEKRSVKRTYFYTGAAGALNTVIYGFAGFRIDRQPLAGALWKKQLKSGWWVSVKPNLPSQWKEIGLPPVFLDGMKHNFKISNKQVAAGIIQH
jgi:trehalose/maltose hydrolase-like predicted phosphorylase